MNKILKNTRHPLVTAKAILNGDDEWLFNPLHKDHGWHFNNLEYLYQKVLFLKQLIINIFLLKPTLNFM